MTNQELIQKAIIALNDLSTGGALNTEQALAFIDYVWDESSMATHARQEVITAQDKEIYKIGINSRVAMTRGVAQDPQRRRGVTTTKVAIACHELVVPFEIEDFFKRFNVEGDAVEDHIFRMFAAQTANDMEELNWTGDTLGPARLESDLFEGGDTTRYIKDDYIALSDGWLKLARGGHQSDANAANISATIFSNLLKALPEKYKRDRTKLRFFCSPDLEQNYREKTATRATVAGDNALNSTAPLTPFGVPLLGIPLMPFEPLTVEDVTMTGVVVQNLLYKNITSAFCKDLVAT